VAVMFLPYGRWVRAAFHVHKLGPVADPLFGMVVWFLGIFLMIYLMDHLLYMVGKIPGLNKVLRISHTQKFLRYLEPHFKPRKRREGVRAKKKPAQVVKG
jgi:elongation factor P--beta-lysine ligase